jgi:hypothetical protein
MSDSHGVPTENDANQGVFRSNLLPRRPRQSPNEVLKAYRFSAEFSGGPFEAFSPDLISVSGLRCSNEPGDLVVSRGVMPAKSEFAYWIRAKYQAADLEIVVDDGIAFIALSVQPVELVYNDLDAGGSNNHILIETVRLHYQSIYPEFHVIKEEK